MADAGTVDQYLAAHADWRGVAMSRIRAAVRTGAPDARESIKWAQPVWEESGPFAWMKAYANHVNVGFWRGTELADPDGLLEGQGDRMRHIRIGPEDAVPEAFIRDFAAQAAMLNRRLGNPTRGR